MVRGVRVILIRHRFLLSCCREFSLKVDSFVGYCLFT